MERGRLYSRTPIVESLNRHCSIDKIFLKLENTQPSGSFKTRGISEHCRKLFARGYRHLVSSSGGNAGLAVAFSARKLGLQATVFVPETTNSFVKEKLHLEGAEVYVRGKVWDEANEQAMEFVRENAVERALVHPFNHREIWEGHSSVIHELKEQLSEVPSAIVLSVGGGGLLCGVLQGLHDVGWNDVPVVACETEGADCFNAAVEAGKPVKLHSITSIAKSLGALEVLSESLEWKKKHTIIPIRVSDREAVSACLKFADDHQTLVEPACGAALTLMYTNKLESLVAKGDITDLSRILIIVCGGSGVNLKQLAEWKEMFAI